VPVTDHADLKSEDAKYVQTYRWEINMAFKFLRPENRVQDSNSNIAVRDRCLNFSYYRTEKTIIGRLAYVLF
jgi:hypothetical protein